MHKVIILKKIKVRRGFKYFVQCNACPKRFWVIGGRISDGSGKFCSHKCANKTNLAIFNPGFKKGHIKLVSCYVFPKGKDNPTWKGNNAKSLAIHNWVRRQLNFPKVCKVCGKTPKKIELANIDHKYRRIVAEYTPLCTSCHRKYDFKKGLMSYNLTEFKFKKGNPPPLHKIGCKCFRCTKIPWNKKQFSHQASP